MLLEHEEKIEVTGGAIVLTDILTHRGQQAVGRFDVWIGQDYRPVELRPGDLVRAGRVACRLESLEGRTHATIEVHEISTGQRRGDLGVPLEVLFGERVVLSGGQYLTLTGVGQFGVELLFFDRDACENFVWFDF